MVMVITQQARDDRQPSPKDSEQESTDAVHRLNGSGSTTCANKYTVGLRYSRTPPRKVDLEEEACKSRELQGVEMNTFA